MFMRPSYQIGRGGDVAWLLFELRRPTNIPGIDPHHTIGRPNAIAVTPAPRRNPY
jgi:hypothetical protein